MAEAKYRLQPVLEKKQRRKDAAQGAMAEAQASLREEEERKEALVAELQRMRDERQEARRRRQEEMLQQGMSGQGASRVQDFVEGTAAREERKQEEIVEQDGRIDKARLRVVEQKLLLTEAAREVQAMEKHKEDWLAQVRKEKEAAEAKEMDEIGTIIHLQRKRDSEG